MRRQAEKIQCEQLRPPKGVLIILMIPRLLFSLLAVCAVGLAQTCTSVSLSSASATPTSSGGNGAFTVSGTPSNCLRTATSNNDWITLASNSGTSAQVTILYTVAPNTGTQSRVGTISINSGQGTYTIFQAGLACTYTLQPQSATIGGTGGSGSIAVNTNAACSWTATPSDPFVTITGNNSGTGPGTVTYSVDPNPMNVERNASIAIGTAVFNIAQNPACSFTVAPAFATILEKATTGTLSVTANANTCVRTAVSDVPWMTISSGASGTGNGTVAYSIQVNNTPTSRIGHITVVDATFTVTQNGANCTYAIVPASQKFASSGGSGAIGLTTTCTWTATPSDPWIVLSSAASGAGNATFNFSVSSNPTALPRSGSIAIGTNIFYVSQDGATCNITLQASSADVPSAGITGSINVNAAQGCGWTATSNAPWITVSGGGSGDGAVTYTAAPNTTTAARTGTITIGNKLFTVTQGGAICDFVIDPASASIPSGSFNGNITVTTACSWTAVPSASWISITSGAAATGNATVSYSIGSNPTAQPRSGTIKIGNQTFSLTQSGAACSLTLSPTTNSVSGPAGTGRFSVNGSTSGCTWKATSNVPWISISGYSSVNGSGAVDFAVEANPTVSPRSGSISVGTESFTVTQTGSVPAITAAGVVNAASFKAGAAAAGEIITIYGTFIGTTPLTTLQLNDAKTGITNALGATRVLFDGVPAPVVYSSATQTSVIVPYSVAGKTTTTMVVEFQGVSSNAVTLNVAAASPAIFALDSSGTGPGAVLNQDFTLNSAANAATRNTIIQIFATGEGATNPVGVDGKLAVAPLPAPVQAVTVRIGNIDAPVIYRGAAPGLVAGVIQINARVPQTAPVGAAVPIVVRVGAIDSPAGITIAVK